MKGNGVYLNVLYSLGLTSTVLGSSLIRYTWCCSPDKTPRVRRSFASLGVFLFLLGAVFDRTRCTRVYSRSGRRMVFSCRPFWSTNRTVSRRTKRGRRPNTRGARMRMGRARAYLFSFEEYSYFFVSISKKYDHQRQRERGEEEEEEDAKHARAHRGFKTRAR